MLARLALRLLTVSVLTARTWAGNRVADSAILPIEERAETEPRPFIAVYTDSATRDLKGRNLLTSLTTVSLVIEIGATAGMHVDLGNGEIEYSEAFPPTDGAIEYVLDVIEWQVCKTLLEPALPSADLWRQFAQSIEKGASDRGAAALGKDGIRFAGRQIVLDIKVPADPVPGAVLGPAWVGLLAWLEGEADPHLAKMGRAIRAALEGDARPPQWLLEQASLGLTREEARALHITPPAPAEATSPVLSPVAPAPAALPVPPVAFEGGDVRL